MLVDKSAPHRVPYFALARFKSQCAVMTSTRAVRVGTFDPAVLGCRACGRCPGLWGFLSVTLGTTAHRTDETAYNGAPSLSVCCCVVLVFKEFCTMHSVLSCGADVPLKKPNPAQSDAGCSCFLLTFSWQPSGKQHGFTVRAPVAPANCASRFGALY